MFLTPHAAAAIAIASVVPNPVLAIPLSFASHFALDAVPHWDNIGLWDLKNGPGKTSKKAFRVILLDALLVAVMTLFFIYFALPDIGVVANLAFCVFAAILPDAYYIPLAFFGKRWGWVMWMVKLQGRIQKNSKAPICFGILTQVALILVCWLTAWQRVLVQLPQIWKIL